MHSDQSQITARQRRGRFSLVSADLGDRNEDMIAIPRWALAVLAGAFAGECGGDRYLRGCVKCEAIRIAARASVSGT